MLPKKGMSLPVLSRRAMAGAIRQSGLQPIEVAARDIGALVHRNSRKVLPHSRSHDAGLAVMRGKALVRQNGRYVGGESLRRARKGIVAGERQIVGISRIVRIRRLRQTGKPAIESVSTDVR